MKALEPDFSVARGSGSAAALAAEWLCLAAAPAFAVMALLSALSGGGTTDLLCMNTHDGLPLNGMTTMYLLMSVFHAAPWLRLIIRRFG